MNNIDIAIRILLDTADAHQQGLYRFISDHPDAMVGRMIAHPTTSGALAMEAWLLVVDVKLDTQDCYRAAASLLASEQAVRP